MSSSSEPDGCSCIIAAMGLVMGILVLAALLGIAVNVFRSFAGF